MEKKKPEQTKQSEHIPEFIMEVVFDEDKVKRDGIYSLESMYKIIDDYFEKMGQVKLGKGRYGSTGHKDDWAKQGRFTLSIATQPWFVDNALSVTWLEYDEYAPDLYWTEDILAQVLKEQNLQSVSA
jgi:hypothetical protein